MTRSHLLRELVILVRLLYPRTITKNPRKKLLARATKNHQELTELAEELAEAIAKLNKNPQDGKLLIGKTGNPMPSEDITKHIKRSFKGIYNPRKVNCQTIRQSVITNLLKAGNDLRIVQVFAGHKNPGTTEKYKQSNMEALKTAIQQYHPLK